MGGPGHVLGLLGASYYFSNVTGSAKPKTHFLSTSLFFNPYVFEKFNSYVSDLFTCKSSECCFVGTI